MRKGDVSATEVVDQYIRYLAEGIADIINIIRPQAVLLGGGVSAEKETLTEPLMRRVNERILGGGKYAAVEIAVAELGNDAGLYGAAKLAMDGQKEKDEKSAAGRTGNEAE